MQNAEKFYFVKLFSGFIFESRKLSKSEILTFLWCAMHADSRGNMIIMTKEHYARLLEFVGVKRESMYNIISRLQKGGYLSKHGDIVIVNSQFANKHRKLKAEVTPYNWSLTELDF